MYHTQCMFEKYTLPLVKYICERTGMPILYTIPSVLEYNIILFNQN